ncbi:hypothetical protein DH2020_015306 [Rehmannia glutinosa]|uniref:Flavin-containing monooxygenase n=1 Tax=Rehmannia glutinosa TaxID=99300 RepID=A0ABR0WVR5_REHGL
MTAGQNEIGIIGGGISGLLACKYTLSKGFNPTVFESRDEVGGVWTKTIRTTKLQTPKSVYQFSDFPWPPSVAQDFPTQNQVFEYIQSYARHHDLLKYVKLNSRVVRVSYEDGPSEEEMWKWTLWGGTVPLEYLSQNRFLQLLVHKPGEGILSTITLVRWGISKFVESHVRKKLRLAKRDMVPNHSFLKLCSVATLPEGFFDRVDQGSIILKKAQRFSFCSQGVVVDGDTEPLKIDLLILATGFRGMDKLKAAFIWPAFRDLIDKEDTTRLPLYRTCVHPRIPQLAFIGFSESFANLFTSDMTCQWLAELLDGTLKLPSIKEMEKDVSQWDKYMKQSSGEYYSRYCLDAAQIWYNDQLCKDMGWKTQRKKGFLRELFEPYRPMDYA